MRPIIEQEAIAFAVAAIDNNEIDRINILKASIKGMHEAVAKLTVKPELLLIDGNRFIPYLGIPHQCIVKGDSKSKYCSSEYFGKNLPRRIYDGSTSTISTVQLGSKIRATQP